jgi:predicted RNA-binding protein YlqC (UPF0109 family)
MAGMSDILRDFVEDTTRMLVDNPKDVDVQASVSTKTLILQIKVNKSDCGKVIGKQGRTIDSLKVICLAIKNTKFPEDSRKVQIEVLEDEDSSYKYNNKKQ